MGVAEEKNEGRKETRAYYLKGLTGRLPTRCCRTRGPWDLPHLGCICPANGQLAGLSFFGYQRSYHSTGITGRKHIRRDVFGHDTARPDHTAVTDADSGTDHGTAADPDVFPDGDGLGKLQSQSSFPVVHGVGGGIDLYVGAKQRTAANGYGCYIQHHAVEVEEHFIPYLDVVAVVAIKGGLQPKALPGPGNELL